LVGIGYEDGNQLVALAFAIVLATVFAHGLSAKPLGKKLDLAYAGRDALIIVGSSSWAIEFAKALINRGVDVIIADKNWHALRAARLADIPTYFGEVLSEETEYHLELARYNILLAVTNNPAYNALICTQFIHEFGRDKVYQFQPHTEDEHERRQIDLAIRGQNFGCSSDDYWDIAGLLNKGWRFRTSRIGQGQTLDEIMEKQKAGTLKILGMLTPKNRLVLKPPQEMDLLDPEHILIAFEQPDEKPQVEEPKLDT
jgi:Trk K+ transport system NAD-binding subunit